VTDTPDLLAFPHKKKRNANSLLKVERSRALGFQGAQEAIPPSRPQSRPQHAGIYYQRMAHTEERRRDDIVRSGFVGSLKRLYHKLSKN